MTITTVNELVDQLQKIAKDHLLLNSFGFGSLDDFEVAFDNDFSSFPNLWVEMISSKGYKGRYTRNLQMFFTDKGDAQEVLSDMEQVAMDVISTFKTQFQEDEVSLGFSYDMTPIYFKGADIADGIFANIELEYPMEYDYCMVPTSGNIDPAPTVPFKYWKSTTKNWNDGI